MKIYKRLLIAGNPEEIHVAAHFLNTGRTMGLDTGFCDSREAFRGPALAAKINWHLRGHRPARLERFSDKVLDMCRESGPRWILATGMAPVDLRTLEAIGGLGVKRLNYLTDDPWNPVLKAPWFMDALPAYDSVFTTRHANVDDLKRLGCKEVSYLPFAYAPELHFPEAASTSEERSGLGCDLLFAGGADKDRVSYITAAVDAGFKVGLYGGYWGRYPRLRPCARGHAGPATLRKAIDAAGVSLCLVRRANRDGHSMRTFEIPAMGGCMLTEATDDHRRIFGEEGRNTLFFGSAEEMVNKLKLLSGDAALRRRLAGSSRDLITNGGNTYGDRLKSMIEKEASSIRE